MSRHQILSELQRRKLSFAEVGRRLSPPATRQAVRNTVYMHGFISSVRIMRSIAGAIECDPIKVFPELAQTPAFIKNANKIGHRALDGQSNKRRDHRMVPHATPLNHAPGTGCNVKMRGYK